MPRANDTHKSHRSSHNDGKRKQDDGGVVVSDVRPIDGVGSNEANPDWGATDQDLLRLAEASIADGAGEMVDDRPNAREISNAVAQQGADEPNSFGLSDMFWAWGQFIDHDLDLTDAAGGAYAPIPVPAGDGPAAARRKWWRPRGRCQGRRKCGADLAAYAVRARA